MVVKTKIIYRCAMLVDKSRKGAGRNERNYLSIFYSVDFSQSQTQYRFLSNKGEL